jgi:hydrogenase maturation protein HypF
MATSYLYRAFGAGFIDKTGKRDRAALIRNMIDRGINSPLTSSAGRLFDGAGSLILGRETAKFEAELPSEMEKMAPDGYEERYEFDISDEPCASVVRVNKIFRGIAGDLSRGFDRRLLSGKFHNTVAAIIVKVAARLGKKYGLDRVVLSGGVFQNRYLTAKAKAGLEKSGFGVYLSPGARTTDAGIPLGQIAIANARLACA